MSNRDLQATWKYHNATKHSHWSVRSSRHFLDWDNYPLPFKIYPTLEPLALPRQMPQSGLAALSVIAAPEASPAADAVPDLATLAHILNFSAGITRKRTHPGGETFFRAAACTGALYEIELYLACADLPGLPAGVYHFSPADFALRRLRSGDYRGVLAHAAAQERAVCHAPLILVSTGTYWRNAWKYQARTYRHFGWDNGTIHANLLAVCSAWRLPARVVCGFLDDEVNLLLDLDVKREVALTLLPVGYVTGLPPEPRKVTPLKFETLPPSDKEVDYASMRALHEASSLRSEDEVIAWRGSPPVRDTPAPQAACFALRPLSDGEIPRDTIEQVILRRGSARKFAREPIGFDQFSTLLNRSTRGITADFLEPFGGQLNEVYVIVHAVEGLRPGAYYFHRGRDILECLKEGDFRQKASYLGLEQELPGDASAAVFFMADLRPIVERFGNRGYRAVQVEAGILGGKMYLAAYAQRLGATGLTFYDDAVTEFFRPHAAGKSTIFLTALGRSARHRQA